MSQKYYVKMYDSIKLLETFYIKKRERVCLSMQGTKNKTLCSIMVGAGGKDSLKEATQKSTGFRMEKLKLSIEVTIQESKMNYIH